MCPWTFPRVVRWAGMIFALLAAASLSATPATVGELRWQKRVLLVSAPGTGDPMLHEQRRILDRWRDAARDRDLVVVEIVADRVTGAADAAAALRGRYRLPGTGFGVALIGKDGTTKLRAARPIPAAMLAETIDAMPMRRDGGR